jgi:hypothetical protein
MSKICSANEFHPSQPLTDVSCINPELYVRTFFHGINRQKNQQSNNSQKLTFYEIKNSVRIGIVFYVRFYQRECSKSGVI